MWKKLKDWFAREVFVAEFVRGGDASSLEFCQSEFAKHLAAHQTMARQSVYYYGWAVQWEVNKRKKVWHFVTHAWHGRAAMIFPTRRKAQEFTKKRKHPGSCRYRIRRVRVDVSIIQGKRDAP